MRSSPVLFGLVAWLSSCITGAPQASRLSNTYQGIQPRTSSSSATSDQSSGIAITSSSTLSTTIYGHLQTCHDGITNHVKTINSQCAQVINENSHQSGANILLEIQSILILTMTCALDIKTATAQSLIGSGLGSVITGDQKSRTSSGGSFSFSDCSALFYSMIVMLQQCYTQIAGVSYKFPVIKQLCADSLAQLSSCLSQIASGCGSSMPGFMANLKSLCAEQLTQFLQIGFGFSQFMKFMQR